MPNTDDRNVCPCDLGMPDACHYHGGQQRANEDQAQQALTEALRRLEETEARALRGKIDAAVQAEHDRVIKFLRSKCESMQRAQRPEEAGIIYEGYLHAVIDLEDLFAKEESDAT